MGLALRWFLQVWRLSRPCLLPALAGATAKQHRAALQGWPVLPFSTQSIAQYL